MCERAEFRRMVHVGDASKIDDLATRLLDDQLTFGVERSFVSKLAVFAQPNKFVAWDSFARKGIASLKEFGTNSQYPTYAKYMEDINYVWRKQKLGKDLRVFLRKRRVHNKAVQLRVFDVYLMIQGEQWPNLM